MDKSQPKDKPRRSVIHRLARILVKIVVTVAVILILVVILIQTPPVQNFIRGKAETYLSRKLKTQVAIGHLYIKFPKDIVLNDIYIGDRQKDTLISAGLIDINIRMWGLLHNQVDIGRVELGNVTAKVKRQLPDTAFNFQFIIDAFAGAPAKEPSKDTSAPMTIALRHLELNKIRLVYKDVVTGNDVETWIEHSETDIPVFDITAMHFAVSRFLLKGLRATVKQTQPLSVAHTTAVVKSDTAATAFKLDLGVIELQDSKLAYLNAVNQLFADLSVDRLNTKVRTFDLDKQVVAIDQLNMDSSAVLLRMGPEVVSRKAVIAGGKRKPSSDTAAAAPWRFTAEAVRFNGNDIQYDDNTQPRVKTGMDYAHLKLTGLTLHADKLVYDKDSISGSIAKGQFKDQSGFELDELHTAFLYTDKRTILQNLLVRTPGSLLQRSVTLQYKSIAAMMKDPAHTLIDLDMPNSRIAVKDVLLFVPALASQPALKAGDVWNVSTHVQGSLANLQIREFQFSGLRDIRVDLSGRLLNPLDSQRIFADLNIRNLSGSKAGIESLLPKGTLPSQFNIPRTFAVTGKLKGGMTGVNTDLTLRTSSGIVIVKGGIQQFRDPKQALYDLALQTKSLDLGYLLKDSVQWGRVTADFTAKGKGFDPQTASAQLHGHIASALIHHYNYREFLFDGSITDHQLELTSSINNDAIAFNLKATGDMTNKFPALKLDWQIDTLDLHALHFVEDTLQFKGHIGADFASTNPDSLDGKLSLAKVDLVKGAQHLVTDSINLIAGRDGDIQDIQLHSEMADLDWKGRYKLTETGTAISHVINDYYRLNGFKDTSFTAQNWQMQLHFRTSPLLLGMMPSLKGTDSAFALLTFNSDADDLRLGIKAPHVQFGGETLENVTVDANTTASKAVTQISAREKPVSGPFAPHPDAATAADPDSTKRLNYRVAMTSGSGSGIALYETSLQGWLANNKLAVTVLAKDQKGKDRYRVAGLLDKLADGLKFVLNPDSMMLNYDKWQVSQDNYVQYDSAGIVINDLKISSQDQSLQVNSEPPAPTSPVNVSFTNFRLSTISRFADQDSLLVDGTLNGKAEIRNMTSTPVFTSDLKIQGLTYRTDTVGDLSIKVDNQTANAFAADIQLQGNKNDMEVKGMYYTGESRMALNLDLRQLNLASMRPFAAAQVKDMDGFLRGKLDISGNLDKPLIKGNLSFDSAMITPVISGEPLKLSNDRIEFDEDGFNFSKFALQDSAGNKATLDGNVYTTDYRFYKFDMSLNADNFRLVNAPAASDRLFYGAMNMDAAINLSGDMDNPKVDGDLRVNKKTNFYFVLPENNPEIVDRQGVVRFVDAAHPYDTVANKAAALAAKAAGRSSVKGMEISMNIQTDSNAVFTIVIDERNGDALNVRGRSSLVFGMDRSGNMELTGGYEIESGSYNLSLNVLKRKFDIQRGSTITWTGNVMEANLDLTANYTANTPSIDLIANEISSRTQPEINKFKQKLPFLVTLKMEGELLKPKITFDITLPQEILGLWPDVDQKLQQIRTQTSELDKQVFALLLLNRFVGEDPLQSEAGGGSSLGNLAFQSASQILTNQLDRLASSLIKGVDIHFDLNNQQDFSTGNEQDYTELNVSVSKRLFNDRIQVSVGSNFDVQGNSNPNQNAQNIAGDAAVDYKLTKDGRYMLRAYRKNQYEAVILGQVVETGVSFILTLDYNKFREIFGKTREEKLEERRANKQKSSGTSPNK